jgi:CheY-like chemotaxis protein
MLIMTATDGQTALKLAQQHQPDLILLDVMLPDVHGVEVVHRLRQNQQSYDNPSIAVTALAKLEDRDRHMGTLAVITTLASPICWMSSKL